MNRLALYVQIKNIHKHTVRTAIRNIQSIYVIVGAST